MKLKTLKKLKKKGWTYIGNDESTVLIDEYIARLEKIKEHKDYLFSLLGERPWQDEEESDEMNWYAEDSNGFWYRYRTCPIVYHHLVWNTDDKEYQRIIHEEIIEVLNYLRSSVPWQNSVMFITPEWLKQLRIDYLFKNTDLFGL